MSILSRLLRKKNPQLVKATGEIKTSGEIITEITDGANLVGGKQTWESTEEQKHDIEFMKKCCDAELRTMDKAGVLPAPYYFQRVAILSRKQKNYKQEVEYCERYIRAADDFYRKHGTVGVADLRLGHRYQAILKRLPRAKELLLQSAL